MLTLAQLQSMPASTNDEQADFCSKVERYTLLETIWFSWGVAPLLWAVLSVICSPLILRDFFKALEDA
jgi:hypothetical protein